MAKNQTIITTPLYKNFTKLRKQNCYSQDYVATKLGISQNAYSKFERGKNALASDNLIKLFELYGADLNVFLEEHAGFR